MRKNRESNRSRVFEFNSKRVTNIRIVITIAILLFFAGISCIVRAHNHPVASAYGAPGGSSGVPVREPNISQTESGASEAVTPIPDSLVASSDFGVHAPSTVTQPRVGTSTVLQGPREFKSTVRIFIHPDDIYPPVVAVRPGKVIISAENNAQRNVALIVERVLDPGRAVARVPAAAQDKRNRQEYTLGAGDYVFYEESRPLRQGKLIVDPKFN